MNSWLLQHAFLRRARRCPGRPALRWCTGGGAVVAWSYGDLERASRSGAHQLFRAGLTPGARVGVWMHKSPSAVAALLAALRAGGCYVPLDPHAPAARIAHLAANCRLQFLFVDPELAAQVATWPEPPLCLPGPQPEPGNTPWPTSSATSDDLAYILYTSGSTGLPKGVMLTHAHALNFVSWAAADARLRWQDRVVSHAPFHFDLSIFDLWACLSTGAEVLLLDPIEARFPRAVADWVLRWRPTVWYSVPSALVQLQPFARELSLPPAAGGLREIIFAGEVFPSAALAHWRNHLPLARWRNWYGPTETNVCAHFTLPATGEIPQPLPIGHSCPNFALAVLNPERRPVEPGETGELWVHGPGVFAGYWGDAPRTCMTLVERNGEGAPQRWYNTGDRVRADEQARLYFEGRGDDLVKVRGYRVSLLEVSAALEACPGVAQAAVILRHLGESGAACLLAFVVADAVAPAPDPAHLRQLLLQQLPAYMVPERVELRSALPLTSSGKVDRQRLRQELEPRQARPAAGEA